MVETIAKGLAAYGLAGLIAGLFIYLYWKRDQDLQKEKDLRIEDAKAFNTMAMSLQKEVITAVNKLADLADILERREDERERNEHATRRRL